MRPSEVETFAAPKYPDPSDSDQARVNRQIIDALKNAYNQIRELRRKVADLEEASASKLTRLRDTSGVEAIPDGNQGIGFYSRTKTVVITAEDNRISLDVHS